MPIEIRRVRPDEWEQFRDIRLRALLDAPDAFGSSYATSAARPDESWIEWARKLAESDDQALFAAGDAGIAGAFRKADTGKWLVFSMWVDPAQRGQGLGRALLDAVVGFVRAQGATEVQLDVTDGNDAARSLYERYGFVDTGVAAPLESNPSLLTRELRLQL